MESQLSSLILVVLLPPLGVSRDLKESTELTKQNNSLHSHFKHSHPGCFRNKRWSWENNAEQRCPNPQGEEGPCGRNTVAGRGDVWFRRMCCGRSAGPWLPHHHHSYLSLLTDIMKDTALHKKTDLSENRKQPRISNRQGTGFSPSLKDSGWATHAQTCEGRKEAFHWPSFSPWLVP